VVPEITTGDHSKRTDGCQRARLRATQRVLAVAVPHQLTFLSARQVEVPCEHLPRIGIAHPLLAVAVRPSSVVAGIAAALVRLRFSRVARSAAGFPSVTIVAIARRDAGLPRVVSVIAIAVIVFVAPPVRGRAFVVARVVVARVEIHTHLPRARNLSHACPTASYEPPVRRHLGAFPKFSRGTKVGQSCAVSGGGQLPPPSKRSIKSGLCVVWLSRVVLGDRAHNPKVGGSNPPRNHILNSRLTFG